MTGNGFLNALTKMLQTATAPAQKALEDLETLHDLKQYIAPLDKNTEAPGTTGFVETKQKIYTALTQVVLHNLRNGNGSEVYQTIWHWCVERKAGDNPFINEVIKSAIASGTTTAREIVLLFSTVEESSIPRDIITFLTDIARARQTSQPIPQPSPVAAYDEVIVVPDAQPQDARERRMQLIKQSFAPLGDKRKMSPSPFTSGGSQKKPRVEATGAMSSFLQMATPSAPGAGSSQTLMHFGSRQAEGQQLERISASNEISIDPRQLQMFLQNTVKQVVGDELKVVRETQAKDRVAISQALQLSAQANSAIEGIQKVNATMIDTLMQIQGNITRTGASSSATPAMDISTLIPGLNKPPMDYTVDDFFPNGSEVMNAHDAGDFKRCANLINAAKKINPSIAIVESIQSTKGALGPVPEFIANVSRQARSTANASKTSTKTAGAGAGPGATGGNPSAMEAVLAAARATTTVTPTASTPRTPTHATGGAAGPISVRAILATIPAPTTPAFSATGTAPTVLSVSGGHLPSGIPPAGHSAPGSPSAPGGHSTPGGHMSSSSGMPPPAPGIGEFSVDDDEEEGEVPIV